MSIDCVNLLKGNTARMTAMFVFWAFFGGHQDSEQLASGSFGVVFLAKDKKTNQQALPRRMPWQRHSDMVSLDG